MTYNSSVPLTINSFRKELILYRQRTLNSEARIPRVWEELVDITQPRLFVACKHGYSKDTRRK